MSQTYEIGQRKGEGKDSGSNSPEWTQAGPSFSSSVHVAAPPSIEATPPIPIYAPPSWIHPGPPSAIQAAFASAPDPESFLELIAQGNAITEANIANANGAQSGQLSDGAPVSDSVTPSKKEKKSGAGPSSSRVPRPIALFPPDILTPPLAPLYPNPVRSSAPVLSSQPAALPVESASRPSNQPNVYEELETFEPLPEPLFQTRRSADRSSYPPQLYEERETFAPEPEPQTQPLKSAASSAYQPKPYGEPGTFEPNHEPLFQTLQSADRSPYRPHPWEEIKTFAPEPKPPVRPAVRPQFQPFRPTGRAAYPGNPYDERETFEPEPDGEATALARLEQAENQHALSLLRLEVRRRQLEHQQQTQRRTQRLHEEEDLQWRRLDEKEHRSSHRR